MRKLTFSLLIFSVFFLLTLLTGTLNAQDKIFPGNNDFDSYIPLIEDKRVALFSNQSGTLEPFTIGFTDEALPETPEGKHILDELIARSIDVVCVFSPEHGFRGNLGAGENVSDDIDEATGVPIISLYNVDVHDTLSDHAEEFDTVLVDIQDVGLRYYTYYITMLRIMNACAELGKNVIILDRPNPNGSYVDGPILQEEFKSGVGALPIPVVHGLTLGEMAMMISGERWLDDDRTCELEVIPCKNYLHSMKFKLTSRPSPNLRTMRAVYFYSSTCYFENTLVSVGRGTDYPFEVLSDGNGYTIDLRNEEITDGIKLSYLIDAYNSIGQENFFGELNTRFNCYWIDLLFGTDSVRKMIQAGNTESEIKETWQADILEFMALRSKYALYPNNGNSAACTNGTFLGTDDNGVITWKGIPYAKPPAGSLRWKAPEAPDESTEVFSADEFAPAALQPMTPFTHASMNKHMNEDCLYLNIWNADNYSYGLKPVVVWVHGGAFQAGATSNRYYQGEKFARDNPDIIFVSVAYRLGLMGFIDFSQVSGGENYPDSGNLGLLDIMQALRWINQNIASFGGNKDNITLMGQSAGAACISMLMTIPESRNLFRRAILESGTVSMHTRKADALPLAQMLLSVTGKTDMAGLASLTQEELLESIETLRYSTNFPETDERILPKDLYSAFEQNAGSFDLLIGTNADELNYWKVMLGQESFDQFMDAAFMATEASIGQYSSEDVMIIESFAEETSNDYPEFFNELCFRGPAIKIAQSHSGNTYMYYWEYPAQIPDNPGACHESELPYFLDNPAWTNMLVFDPDVEVQARVQSFVSSFIRTGNPSTESAAWPQYDSSTRATMIFTETGDTETENDPLSEERELIAPLLKWGISGRELVNGDISSGISVDPGDFPEPEPEPDSYPAPALPGSPSGGCDSGISFVSAIALMMFMMRRKDHNA